MKVLVTDASIIVDLLARFNVEPIEELLFDDDSHLVAPELLDIEVLHTLRKLEANKAIPESRIPRLLNDFRMLRIRRFRHATLWHFIWDSRQNLTAYDTAYVELARQLEATLVTRDKRLARALGKGVSVQVV